MSIATNETSVDTALPLELYEVSFTGNFWYMASGDSDLEFDGRLYRAMPIQRDDIEGTANIDKATLTVKFPRDVPFAELFRITPPSEVVSFRLLYQNYLIPSEYVTLWKGRIINGAIQGSWWVATVENIFTSIKRPGLRRRYSINCTHALYGPKCGVSREAWKETTTVLEISGLTVTLQSSIGKPDNYYAGGFLTYSNSVTGNIEKRMIRGSVGATGVLTLAGSPIGLVGGMGVYAYAGCDHTLGAGGCPKFSNIRRYGGQPYYPKKNPYSGSILYS